MYKVTGPIVQHLGFQGDTYLLKVVFPVHQVKEEDPNYHDVEQEQQPAGLRAVILRFRAEDLPMHTTHGEIVHCNVGRYIREQFGPFCKNCGETLKSDATCSNSGCPYFHVLQNATVEE